MRIALISDIHGNFSALTEVLKKIDQMGITDIYCLGDVVGYFTEINECCDELRKRGVRSIMGNHDWYLVGKSFCPRSNSVNDLLVYQKKVISQENFEWLSSFPLFRQVGELSMVHGGWTNPIDEYVAPSEEYFSKIDGKYFVSGHAHVQTVQKFGEKVYCNPGSVGQPRDEDPRAAFATFESNTFQLHRVEYDIDRVGALMEKAGFSGYYYGSLYTGSKRLQWPYGQKPTE
jgi:predicted phosphodiesterase